MSKVKTLLLLGAGYVAGAQAGRGRYEQLKQQATRVVEHPRTQKLTQQARETVAARLPSAVNDDLRTRIAGTPAARTDVSDAAGSGELYPRQNTP